MFHIYFGNGQYLSAYSGTLIDGQKRIAVNTGCARDARVYKKTTAIRVLRDARRVMGGGWLIPAQGGAA